MMISHHSVVGIKTSSSRTNSNRISTSSSSTISSNYSTNTNSKTCTSSNQTSNNYTISSRITDNNNSTCSSMVVTSNSKLMTLRCSSSKCTCRVTNSSNSSNLSKTVLCSKHPKTPTKCSKWTKLKMLRQPLPRLLQLRPPPQLVALMLALLLSKLPQAPSLPVVKSRLLLRRTLFHLTI